MKKTNNKAKDYNAHLDQDFQRYEIQQRAKGNKVLEYFDDEMQPRKE